MFELVVRLFIIAIIIAAIVFCLSWKIFFRVGKKTKDIANNIREEMERKE